MAVQLERSQARLAPDPQVEAFTTQGVELVTNHRLTITPSFAEIAISGRTKNLRGRIQLAILTDLAVAAQSSQAVPRGDLIGTAVAAGSTGHSRHTLYGHISELRSFLEDDHSNPQLLTTEGYNWRTEYRLNIPPEAISFVEDKSPVLKKPHGVVLDSDLIDFSVIDPHEVAHRAAQRDEQAFAHLYGAHLDTVLRFVFFKVGDAALAEDLAAETFSKAWENVDRFEWRDLPFQHWLLRVARNVVIDHWRANRQLPASLDGLYDVATDEPAPDEIVVFDSEVERLSGCLKRLPDDQREVLTLRFIDGFSHADTAQVVGKTVIAVRQIQVRALKALRAVMREADTTFVAGSTKGLAAVARRSLLSKLFPEKV